MSLKVYLDETAARNSQEIHAFMQLFQILHTWSTGDPSYDIYFLGWPFFNRHHQGCTDSEVEHDFTILTPRTFIVGDFKNYSGKILDGGENGPWTLSLSGNREITVRGGSQGNPYRQLYRNRKGFVELLNKTATNDSALWGLIPQYITTE